MNESEFPALYQAADTASKKAQKIFFGALGINLCSLVIAAFFSVINYPAAWFLIIQTIILLTSLGLTIYLAHMQPQRIWYGTRALAESLKTVTWRYMMKAEPFDVDDTLAKRHFIGDINKILDVNKKICSHAIVMTNNNQITSRMSECRALSLSERKIIYLDERVENQLNWYQQKALLNKKLSSWWFGGLIIVNSIAVILSIVRVAYPTTEHWPTDIFIAAAGGVMAWLQTKRFQELAASYALTTHEISLLKNSSPDDCEEHSFSVFVGDSENAFSREHTQWLARRDAD